MKITLSEIRQLVRQELNEAKKRTRKKTTGSKSDFKKAVEQIIDLHSYLDTDGDLLELHECYKVLEQLPERDRNAILFNVQHITNTHELANELNEKIKAELMKIPEIIAVVGED